MDQKKKIEVIDNVKESEVKVGSIEDHIEDLKEYEERCTKDCAKGSHQEKEVVELCNKVSKSEVEVQECRALKES